jgi:CheY-like chemotaxis protein
LRGWVNARRRCSAASKHEAIVAVAAAALPYTVRRTEQLQTELRKTAMTSEILKYSIDILMVEDNATDVRLTEEALNNAKVLNSLSVVGDGEAALDFLYQRGRYATAERPDLVLLDLNLPKIDGREVLRIMKSDERLKSIPVVVLTVSNDEADMLRAYKLGAHCYITKPVDFQRFTEIIKTINDFWITAVMVPT